ncbi:hypothetical protein BDV12DRAFT_119821 [Aspergillus spectabilis]
MIGADLDTLYESMHDPAEGTTCRDCDDARVMKCKNRAEGPRVLLWVHRIRQSGGERRNPPRQAWKECSRIRMMEMVRGYSHLCTE